MSDRLLESYYKLEEQVLQLQSTIAELKAGIKKYQSALLNISAGSITADTIESIKFTASQALKAR